MKTSKVDRFIQRLLAKKLLKQVKPDPDYDDGDSISFKAAKGVVVEYDGDRILDLCKYEDGSYMVITPCGVEHLNEVTLTASNIKKFDIYTVKRVYVNMKAFT